MIKILKFLFWASVFEYVVDGYTARVGKNIATHLYKLVQDDKIKADAYCAICGESITFADCNSLYASIDDAGKVRVIFHTKCLRQTGYDVCTGECCKVTPIDELNKYGTCKKCEKKS